MANQAKSAIILAPIQAADNSIRFSTEGKSDGKTITVEGLQTTETATVQILSPVSNTFINYYPAPGGALIQFTATLNSSTLFLDAGTYRIAKSITANAVGIGIQFFI